MSIVEILTNIGVIFGSIGGVESIKWFFNRKTNERLAKAEAYIKEFDNYKAQIVFLQESLRDREQDFRAKEERFQEKIQHERELLDEINNLTTEVAVLRTERQLKLCEVRGCPNRKPQSGF